MIRGNVNLQSRATRWTLSKQCAYHLSLIGGHEHTMHCNGNQSYPINDSPLGVKTKSQVCSHEIWSRIGVGLFKQVCVSSFASSLVTYISPFLSVLCVFWIIDFPATGVQVFTGIQVVCWEWELARGRGVAEGVKLVSYYSDASCNITTSFGFILKWLALVFKS